MKNTPTPTNPADSLVVGDAEQRLALAKLTPVFMPNDTIKDESIIARMDNLRNNFKYIYVINWIYQCRGFLKLASEHFDVDLFEIELLNMVIPVPIDEMVLFSNKLKLTLISKIQGKKVSSLGMFEPIFRMYFGNNTPLQGPEESESDEDIVVVTDYPNFDFLNIEDKFEILFLLIREVTLYPDFREFVEKDKLPLDFLRTPSIYNELLKLEPSSEDYILLFDDTALYKRTTNYPELSIPKKRKLAPTYPDSFFEPSQFDVVSVSYELVYKNVFQYNDYVKSLKSKKNKKNKVILESIHTNAIADAIFEAELKKRRVIANRRREFELARLMATRKRSSRLEAKEKQKQEEEEERRKQEIEELKFAASRRAARRRDEKVPVQSDYTTGLSREDRLALRNSRLQAVREAKTQPEVEVIPENGSTEQTLQEPKPEPINSEPVHPEPIHSEHIQTEPIQNEPIYVSDHNGTDVKHEVSENGTGIFHSANV